MKTDDRNGRKDEEKKKKRKYSENLLLYVPIKPITFTGVLAKKKKNCSCENTVPQPNKLSYFTERK